MDDATRVHNETQDRYLTEPDSTELSMTTKDAGSSLGVEDVLTRVRRLLARACGVLGINAARALLRRMDTSGDNLLSRVELQAGLEELGARLSGVDMQAIMVAFDTDKR